MYFIPVAFTVSNSWCASSSDPNTAGTADATGTAIVDIGCYEYLNPNASSSGDGITDGWAWSHGLNPTTNTAGNDLDGDGFNNLQEYIADTDATNPASYFRSTAVSNVPPWTVCFDSSSSRLYTLYRRTNLTAGAWLAIPGQTDVPGAGGPLTLRDTNAPPPTGFYHLGVRLP